MNNNVIQIKRGNGHPGTILQPYEPGIDTIDDNHFYIGGPLEYSDSIGDSNGGMTSNPLTQSVSVGQTSQAQEIKVGFAMGLLLSSNNFGTDFPANPKEGQVFFQLLTE